MLQKPSGGHFIYLLERNNSKIYEKSNGKHKMKHKHLDSEAVQANRYLTATQLQRI